MVETDDLRMMDDCDYKVVLGHTESDDQIATVNTIFRETEDRAVIRPLHKLRTFGWQAIYFRATGHGDDSRISARLTIGKPLFKIEPAVALERIPAERRESLTKKATSVEVSQNINDLGTTKVPTLLAYVGHSAGNYIDLLLFPDGTNGIDYLVRPIAQHPQRPYEPLNNRGVFRREEMVSMRGLHKALSETSAQLLESAPAR
ncbi:MAG TPA: hypothetical protein VFH99_00410 [Candidatus Saccharimonadales bacterium]|nr:hypothetical protein [Candidatus Saccharimonadales bacterium]